MALQDGQRDVVVVGVAVVEGDGQRTRGQLPLAQALDRVTERQHLEPFGHPGADAVEGPGVDLGADEVREFCRARLADDKVPRAVTFLDALPRNATGKLLKTELRKRFTGVEGGVVQR